MLTLEKLNNNKKHLEIVTEWVAGGGWERKPNKLGSPEL